MLLGEGTIASGNRGIISERIYFNEGYRHYWMLKCKIGTSVWQINKNNAMANVDTRDTNSIIRFTLRKHSDSNYIRLYITMNSGNSYFYMNMV